MPEYGAYVWLEGYQWLTVEAEDQKEAEEKMKIESLNFLDNTYTADYEEVEEVKPE